MAIMDMQMSRIISGAIYVGGIVLAIVRFESKEIFLVLVCLAVPVAMIWYPNEINDYTIGTFGVGGEINKPTPPAMISGFGWICLIGFVLFNGMEVFQ